MAHIREGAGNDREYHRLNNPQKDNIVNVTSAASVTITQMTRRTPIMLARYRHIRSSSHANSTTNSTVSTCNALHPTANEPRFEA